MMDMPTQLLALRKRWCFGPHAPYASTERRASEAAKILRDAARLLEQQKAELAEARAELVRCGDCGHAMTEVRPGKHQCDYCELQADNERLEAAAHAMRQAIAAVNCSELAIRGEVDLLSSRLQDVYKLAGLSKAAEAAEGDER